MTLWMPAAGAVVSGIVSCAAMPAFIRWARRRGVIDLPNARSSHAQPVPRGGGLLLVIVTIVGALAAWWIDRGWPATWMGAYLAGSVAIAAVSWIDDLRGVPTGIRLAVHVAAAVVVVAAVRDPGHGWLWQAAAVIWIVGVTNAYNFMDGIDGIAASQALVAGAGWVGLGWHVGDGPTAILGALVGGGAAGFLVHNRPPARVFMGDVGSAFLGFTFAALSLFAGAREPHVGIAGALFLFPFLFDTAYTLLRRVARGENPVRAHRTHLYQRLVARGRSHREVTLTYAGLAVVGVALSWIWIAAAAYRLVALLLLVVACASMLPATTRNA
jgi:Fuc2NAc and GlcNAc transferase